MEKAVCKIFTSARIKKASKICLLDKINVQLILVHLSTVCEQTFALMNFNKSKQRSSLTDEHLKDLLKVFCSSIEPNYAERVANKRCDISRKTLYSRFVFFADILSMLAMYLS